MDYVLMHHGIKGQKWGSRRYQNEDGTLTPLGYERYGRSLKGSYHKMLSNRYNNREVVNRALKEDYLKKQFETAKETREKRTTRYLERVNASNKKRSIQSLIDKKLHNEDGTLTDKGKQFYESSLKGSFQKAISNKYRKKEIRNKALKENYYKRSLSDAEIARQKRLYKIQISNEKKK